MPNNITIEVHGLDKVQAALTRFPNESVGLGEIVFAKPPRIRLEIVSIENGVITAKVAEFEQPTKLGTILIGKAGDLPNA